MKFLSKLADRLTTLTTGRAGTPNSSQPKAPITPPDPAQQAADVAQLRADFGARYDGPWPLDRVLFNFRTTRKRHGELLVEPLTLSDAFKGMFVTGGVGAGKTSGTGAHMAQAFLKDGWGGLVLCVKVDEAESWKRRVINAGRGGDLVMFGQGEGDGFNFLKYEMDAGKGNPSEAAVSVLMELVGANSIGGENKIWEKATRRLLKMCVLAMQLAEEPVTLKGMYQLATDQKQVDAVLLKGQARVDADALSKSDKADFEVTKAFLSGEWKNMNPNTKTSVLMTTTTLIDPFLTGVARELFTEGTTHTPDDILAGKVLVVTLGPHDSDDAGRAANILWKFCTQRAVQRQPRGDTDRPIFIYADEAQEFVTTTDFRFVTTSRSARCSMIYLTQLRSNFYTRMRKEEADPIVGCFQTKVFHHQTDPDTCTWASDIIARVFITKASNSTNYQTGEGAGQGSGGVSHSESLEHQLQPIEYSRLMTGGLENDLLVSAYLYMAGKKFATTGKNHVLVVFHQSVIKI